MSRFFILLSFATALHVYAQTSTSSLVDLDPKFPGSTIADYTLRYLSTNGNDNEECLQSQSFPPVSDHGENRSSTCGTLRYAITGSHNVSSFNVSNVVLLIWPGQYGYGKLGVSMTNFINIVVRKVPGSEGEVVLQCDEYLNNVYNNLYFFESSYVLLKELVFTKCGPLSPGMATYRTQNIRIEKCIYR